MLRNRAARPARHTSRSRALVGLAPCETGPERAGPPREFR
ncbi:hypothetical protein roselon_02944 [Roseibacterium elongatum DSM 19469]|uniref:Uncharacterized protein n=1 Tax=Roseicyclus elongatus DSM 19469 TaxID=1294273 RepID=W8RVI8_9RHOB|nr:hypothetical protein roselon_02944 [Roseibacterium elongatum DSM 19469]